MRVRPASLLGSVLFVAACAESPVMPAATASSASLAQVPTATGYVIAFKNDNIPTTFVKRVSALGGTVTASYDGAGVAVVNGLTATTAATLADFGDVRPDVALQIIDPVEARSVRTASVSMNGRVASPTNPAGAYFFGLQWNMSVIGAPAAWAAGKRGSPAVKVAIIDTGIDPAHPDLAGRVDAANSVSFVPGENAFIHSAFPGYPDWTDLHFHGTHVAATVSSNALAAAGVTSRTTLMAVKVLNYNGVGTIGAMLAGVVFAADHKADIISMSLGSPDAPYDLKDKENREFFHKVLDKVFKYAHSKGSMVIVAAGNEQQNLAVPHSFKMYCSAPHAMCVSATGPTDITSEGELVNPDAFAWYSNYGLGQIDIAAPGGTDAAPIYAACSTTSVQIPICQTGVYVIGLEGTSMSTPHVSGLAALLMAEKKTGDAAVRSAIFNSAVDLGAPGKDAFFGNGRINVAKALGLH
jgi:subtilisin family serine protease